ncbi:MAG: hypothetical protein KGH60_03325 [Candidatus Micrarchaeota archaeon]|nr:hypothetical protein [Candidatus Micrarchaeota archaeon]
MTSASKKARTDSQWQRDRERLIQIVEYATKHDPYESTRKEEEQLRRDADKIQRQNEANKRCLDFIFNNDMSVPANKEEAERLHVAIPEYQEPYFKEICRIDARKSQECKSELIAIFRKYPELNHLFLMYGNQARLKRPGLEGFMKDAEEFLQDKEQAQEIRLAEQAEAQLLNKDDIEYEKSNDEWPILPRLICLLNSLGWETLPSGWVIEMI